MISSSIKASMRDLFTLACGSKVYGLHFMRVHVIVENSKRVLIRIPGPTYLNCSSTAKIRHHRQIFLRTHPKVPISVYLMNKRQSCTTEGIESYNNYHRIFLSCALVCFHINFLLEPTNIVRSIVTSVLTQHT